MPVRKQGAGKSGIIGRRSQQTHSAVVPTRLPGPWPRWSDHSDAKAFCSCSSGMSVSWCLREPDPKSGGTKTCTDWIQTPSSPFWISSGACARVAQSWPGRDCPAGAATARSPFRRQGGQGRGTSPLQNVRIPAVSGSKNQVAGFPNGTSRMANQAKNEKTRCGRRRFS